MFSEYIVFKSVFIIGNFSILTFFFLYFIKKKDLRFALSMCTIAFIAITLGLRNKNVALDTPKYIYIYESANIQHYYENYVYEPLFIFISIITKYIFNYYNLFLMFLTFLHLFLILIAYKNILKNSLYTIAMAIYISTFTFWLSNLSMLRQGLAIAIFTYALSYLINGKYRKSIILGIITLGIHFSGAIYFIVYFLFKILRRIYKKPLIFYVLVLLIIFLLLYPDNLFLNLIKNIIKNTLILFPSNQNLEKVYWYLIWDKKVEWHIKHVYYLILILFIIYTFILRVFRSSSEIPSLQKSYTIFTVSLIMLIILKFDEMVADRIFMYFVPIIPILLVNTYWILNKNYRFILLIVFIIGSIIWFNIKVLYLQYSEWFIYPYPSVR